MIFTKHQNLADRIVDYLAYHPYVSLREMRKDIELNTGRISYQAWYKSLRKLLDDGVIVKNNLNYSLNTTWASKLASLSFFVKSNYLNPKVAHSVALPQREKTKKKYKFPDLLTMDMFWGHVAVTLIIKNPGRPFYFYNPHVWFFVAHEFESKAYFESIQFYNVKNYTIVGSRSSIDLWSEKLHPKKSSYYCSPKPLFDHRLYLTVIGDCYIEVKIREQMARQIDDLFKQTLFDSKRESPPDDIKRLFKQKSPCVMTIEKNKEKADKFARKIRRYF